MAENDKVNLAEVRRNAKLQGIPLAEIALIYRNLTTYERNSLQEWNLLVYDGPATVVARLTETGDALFEDKVTDVYYLGA